MALQQDPNPGNSHVVPLRIERGAVAEAVDGPLGTIEQIVMDRTSGQMSALVIRGSESDIEFELPARYINTAESTGNHVRLSLSRRDLSSNPELTKPYNPDQYTPVYQGEALPEQVASRVAAETERPVVTDIEENAADMVVAGTDTVATATPATDTGIATGAVAAGAASTGMRTPRDEAAPSTASTAATSVEDTTPTVKLNAAQPSTGDTVAGDQRTAPAPEPSPTPETTGALMGGKPSTSGMGEKSYVPTSPAPALDTVPTSADLPPYSVEHPDDTTTADTGAQANAAMPATPNLAPAANTPQAMEGGVEPATGTPIESSAQSATLADADLLGTPESVLPPDPALGRDVTPILSETMIAPEALETPIGRELDTSATTPTQPQVLDQLKDRLPSLLVSLGRSQALLLAAGGLAAGIAAGIVLRRRNDAGYQARHVLSQAGGRTQETAERTRDQASMTTSQARDAAGQLATSAREVLRRAGDKAQATARDVQGRLPSPSDQIVPRQAQDTATQVAAQAKVSAAQAKEQARSATAQFKEQARSANRQTQKAAKRTARRFRWFRRGLLVGGAVSALYAPLSGSELRARITSTLEEWRSRIA